MSGVRHRDGPGRLGLPESARRRVFRRIVKQLRNDPILSRTLKFAFAWEGEEPAEGQEFGQSMAPCIRLTPSFGPDTWAFPSGFRGWMFIKVEMLIEGTDVGDMVDLWWAIMLALYPPNPAGVAPSPGDAFQLDLRHLGAYTGQIEFSQPAAAEAPADAMQYAIGELKCEVRLYVNV